MLSIAKYAKQRHGEGTDDVQVKQLQLDLLHQNPLCHDRFPQPPRAQLTSFGSTFYASGYDDGNKDGWVLMQTLSGVADDGREVIAVVAPGKFSAGSSVVIEAPHVVDKPAGLDWERAAILPFLVGTLIDHA